MEIHDDDKPVGRVLTRREVIKLLGGGGAILLGGLSLSNLVRAQGGTITPAPSGTEEALPSCIVRPEQTEGPYFVDEMLNRFDIRSDPNSGILKAGTLLHLKFLVSQITPDACTPLKGAQVDIWHCDAEGAYSGVEDRSFNTEDEYWLRGYQVTDENGVADFLTIYPGWYPGRTVHIHFKIRTEDGYEFTSQLYFPEELTDVIHEEEPYSERGYRNTLNEDDMLYRDGGENLMLAPVEVSAEEFAVAVEASRKRAAMAEATAEQTPEITPEATVEFEEGGYTAVFTIGLDLS